MIYTVTVNPCLDVLRFLQISNEDRTLAGGDYRPINPNEDEKVRPGGKGIDVSRALVCLRSETKALGFIGDQTGDIVKGLLEAEGIDHGFIESGVETRTNIILVLQKKGSQERLAEIRVNSRGREIPPNKFHLLYDQAGKIEDAEAVAISGSLSFNMQPTFYNFLISTFKKRNPRCVVILDGPPEATAEAIALPQHRPDFIKPNLSEFNELLLHLTGRARYLLKDEQFPPTIDRDDYLEYSFTGTKSGIELTPEFTVDEKGFVANWHKLLEHVLFVREEYSVGALLSLGPFGCLTSTDEGEVLHAYIPERIDAKTRVGAGDTLVAGFLARYVGHGGGSVADGLKSAVAAATARVCVQEQKGNTKFLSLSVYRELLERVCIDEYRPSKGGRQSPRFLGKIPSGLSRFALTRPARAKLTQSKPNEKNPANGKREMETLRDVSPPR